MLKHFYHYTAPGQVQNLAVAINNPQSVTVTWRSPLQGANFISSYYVVIAGDRNYNKTVYSTSTLSATFDTLCKKRKRESIFRRWFR